jgi:hypothetical protein
MAPGLEWFQGGFCSKLGLFIGLLIFFFGGIT